jgi:hypothetical protein
MWVTLPVPPFRCAIPPHDSFWDIHIRYAPDADAPQSSGYGGLNFFVVSAGILISGLSQDRQLNLTTCSCFFNGKTPL